MTNQSLNDNVASHADPARTEPHGQAALLLVESLIHGLVSRSIIQVADAVEIVDVASAVKELFAVDRDEPLAAAREALQLLAAISASLSIDLTDGQRPA